MIKQQTMKPLGTVVCKPTREMIDIPVEETLIVELIFKVIN